MRYIPSTPGDIILTSRNRRASFAKTKLVSLKPFTDEDGGKLLRQLLKFPETQLTTVEDEKATTSLARLVGGLPLGIRHLAGLINERDQESVSEFMEMYTEFPRELMMDAAPAFDYDKDISRAAGEEHPLDRVWTISFGSLKPPMRTLLGIASFLSPDQIPLYLFDKVALNEKPERCADLSLVCTKPKCVSSISSSTPHPLSCPSFFVSGCHRRVPLIVEQIEQCRRGLSQHRTRRPYLEWLRGSSSCTRGLPVLVRRR